MATNPTPEAEQTPEPVAPAHRAERNWRAAVSGEQPAFAWAVAACLGAISISAAPRDTLVRLILPVAVMVVYVWVTYPREASASVGLRATRIAQLADSAYFLGFLWTLWALIDSFVLRGATSSETAFRVFGFALVTTATGTAIRLFLLQFKYGAIDQTGEAELTVERNLQVFSESMRNASQSIQSFHKYAEVLNQGVNKVATVIESLDRQFADTHQQTTKTIKDNITEAVDDIRAALKAPTQEYGRAIRAFTANVDQQSQVFIDVLQKSSGNLDQAIRDATESAHSILRTATEQIVSDHLELSDRLGGQTARILEELHNLTTRMASLDIPPDGLRKIVDSFNQLERALLAVAGLLRPDGQLRANLVRFGDEVQLQTDTVAKALTNITIRINSIKVPPEAVIDISELTRAIAELRTSVDGLLQRASDQRWQTAPQGASDAIFKLTTAITNLRQTVSNTDEAIKKNVSAPDVRRSRRGFPRNLWPW
jgi:archaellum component FlaC